MDSTNTLTLIKMLDEGIIPFFLPSLGSIDDSLKTMNPRQARSAKRKFRKLWRAAIKLEKKNNIHFNNLMAACGVGLQGKDLLPCHMRYRARLVYKMLLQRALTNK